MTNKAWPDYDVLVNYLEGEQHQSRNVGYGPDNAALLAVLELHKPWQGSQYLACTIDHGDDWPCPTYVALATPFIGLVP